MQKQKRDLFAAASLILALGLSFIPTKRSHCEIRPDFNMAVSQTGFDHQHRLPIRSEDISIYISLLDLETDSISFYSSYNYGDGSDYNDLHSHEIKLNKVQLTQLRDTGKLALTSENSAEHRHVFEFNSKNYCPAIFNFS